MKQTLAMCKTHQSASRTIWNRCVLHIPSEQCAQMVVETRGRKRLSSCCRDGAESYSVDPDVLGLRSVDFLAYVVKGSPTISEFVVLLHLELDWEKVVCEKKGMKFTFVLQRVGRW